ncbi:MAG: Cna B-type domain-containing protein, partial [Oscillospiraceae bacterium]|nr:Cna B-type domain-containing protein [Oscillospiraceae bacterium]
MKHLLKLITVLMTVVAMLCACVMPGFAYSEIVYYGEGAYDVASEGGDNGWGDWEGIRYTENDLFGSFKNLMPGDSRFETIVFRNEAEDSDYVNLYMKFVPHDESDNPLTYDEAAENADGKDQSNVEGERDETVASMTDFLNQLTMRVYNGEELLYEGPATGLGYEAEGPRAGFRALTVSPLDVFISLGTISTGDTIELLVELIVPIELGNEYANRVGEVDISFLLETFQTEQLTVRKVWSDGNDAHYGESVTVNLLKNGSVEKTAELNAENGWIFTFD